jgi:hypothetical protein
VCVCVCVCVCVSKFCTQELETQSTVTAIAGLYKFSVKKLVRSRFGPSDNYSWSNVIFYLYNNILSPSFKASPNKICASFKTVNWNSKPILLQKSFESQNTKDCWHKSIMTVWHSELFLCFVGIRNHGESLLKLLRLSVRIYTWRNYTVAKRISMKFDIGKFY